MKHSLQTTTGGGELTDPPPYGHGAPESTPGGGTEGTKSGKGNEILIHALGPPATGVQEGVTDIFPFEIDTHFHEIPALTVTDGGEGGGGSGGQGVTGGGALTPHVEHTFSSPEGSIIATGLLRAYV